MNPQNDLGSGGEAVVVRQGNEAFKIFHKPTPRKIKKVETLIRAGQDLPKQVLAPKELVYAENGKPVGYVMALAPKGSEEMRVLFNLNFRKKSGILLPQVVSLFLDGHTILEALHQKGWVVGDLNDLNEVFLEEKIFFLDTDSFQNDRFPCEVGTEKFISPELYGKNLAQGSYFSEITDWYSFAVLFFYSVLLVHPYGGAHPKLLNLMGRAKNRVTALDKEVTYPNIGAPPEILSANLRDLFERFFKRGEEITFPKAALEEYLSLLDLCPKCGQYFPKERQVCPICKTRVISPARKTAKYYEVVPLLSTRGEFILTRLQGGHLYALAEEDGQFVLYSLLRGVKRREVLFPARKGLLFDFAFGSVVVGEKASKKVWIFDPGKGTWQETATGLYKDLPVFAGTEKALFRLAGDFLVRAEPFGDTLVDRTLATMTAGQSWFSAQSDSQKEALFLATTLFGQNRYELLNQSDRMSANVADLHQDEKLVHSTLKKDSKGVLLIRLTKERGHDFVRFDLLNWKGERLTSLREDCDESEYSALQNAAFGNATLITATPYGLTGRSLATRTTIELAGSDKFIDGNEILWNLGGNILVQNDQEIFLVEKRR